MWIQFAAQLYLTIIVLFQIAMYQPLMSLRDVAAAAGAPALHLGAVSKRLKARPFGIHLKMMLKTKNLFLPNC